MDILIKTAITIWITGAVACFLGFFLFAYRMWKGRKSEVTGAHVMWNQFNICFMPSLLTEQGLRDRRRFFLCFVGFAILIALPGLLALLLDRTT